MWTKEFWKAAAERMIRGAAVAVSSAFFVADVAVDIMNVNTIEKLAALAIGGALSSLFLSLAGGTIGAGNGPSFTGNEELK